MVLPILLKSQKYDEFPFSPNQDSRFFPNPKVLTIHKGAGPDCRKRRKRTGVLAVSKKKSRKLLPFNPSEDPVRRLEHMAFLASASMATGIEFSNELTYVSGMAPRSANLAALERDGMQVAGGCWYVPEGLRRDIKRFCCLNLIKRVAGGCWYVLAIQRVASCLKQQCALDNPCGGGGNSMVVVRSPLCLDVNGPFHYGIYRWALPVVSSNSVAVKILYLIFWGLMTLR